jgi:ABC-type amino acid transport substrate-binding protein
MIIIIRGLYLIFIKGFKTKRPSISNNRVITIKAHIMKVKTYTYLSILFLLLICAPFTTEAQTINDSEKVLIIGTKEVPPFSFKDINGKWTGITVELWESIADEIGIKYQYEEHSLKELLDGVTDSSIDVALGSITLTTEREKQFDFTHPYYNTGLCIAVQSKKGSIWKSVLKEFISIEFLSVIGLLLGTMILIGLVIWLFERKKNEAEFGGSARKGISSGIWWSIVTMTAVGYGDKVPRTAGGKLFAGLWMFMGIILVSLFIATITSILTVSQLEYSINGPEDLRKNTVGTISYSTSEIYLKDNRIVYISYQDINEALEALDDGIINALVYDKPLLQYYINRNYKGKIDLVPHTFLLQDYGIALPQGSSIREPINRMLLKKIHEDAWQDLLYKHLGSTR